MTLTNPCDTGVLSDLAISGQGYFVLRDVNSSRMHVTRFGEFMLDASGFLVSSDGMRVQGFSDLALTHLGDIRIDNLSYWAPVEAYTINPDGEILVLLADGTELVRGQILLQNFSHPEKLQKSGKYVYAWDEAAEPLPQARPPGSFGLGSLQTGKLELPVLTLQLNRVQGPPSLLAHGLLHQTGVPTDLGIEGDGFFILRDTNSQTLFATRAGAFEFDPDGFLVNYSGFRVQGYSSGNMIEIGDVRVDQGNQLYAFDIQRSGKIVVCLPDGTIYDAGQILLRDCLQPAHLAATNFALFPVNTDDTVWTPMTAPEESGFGWIAAGTVETKQFDQPLLAERRKKNYFTQGSLVSTTNLTDLSVNGRGFFIVRNPADNAPYATRCGRFHLDAAGHLVTINGWRVQGLSDMALSSAGDVMVDTSQEPTGTDSTTTLHAFNVNLDGRIILLLSDGTVYVRGQITLQEFRDPQALKSTDRIYFTNLTAALPVFNNAAPGSSGLGMIIVAALEMIPSDRLPELEPLPQSGFRVQAKDVMSGGTTIESSEDLVHWVPLGQLQGNDIGAAEFFDTNTPVAWGRFYRTHTTTCLY